MSRPPEPQSQPKAAETHEPEPGHPVDHLGSPAPADRRDAAGAAPDDRRLQLPEPAFPDADEFPECRAQHGAADHLGECHDRRHDCARPRSFRRLRSGRFVGRRRHPGGSGRSAAARLPGRHPARLPDRLRQRRHHREDAGQPDHRDARGAQYRPRPRLSDHAERDPGRPAAQLGLDRHVEHRALPDADPARRARRRHLCVRDAAHQIRQAYLCGRRQ